MCVYPQRGIIVAMSYAGFSFFLLGRKHSSLQISYASSTLLHGTSCIECPKFSSGMMTCECQDLH